MKILASLLSIALLAAPAAGAHAHLASSASESEVASEFTYAANNPVSRRDTTGSYSDEMHRSWDRAAAAQMALPPEQKISQARFGVSLLPGVGDYIAAAISIGEFLLSPSMANAETAGWDSLGAAVPGLPAVGTMKKVDPATQLAKNKEAGAAFEKVVGEGLQKEGKEVATQVTLQTPSGTRTRPDFLTRDPTTGDVAIVEAKASATAPLTKGQAAAFPEIEKTGAVVVGKGKPGFPAGTQIPPTKPIVKRNEE